MPRDFRAKENQQRAKAKRQAELSRPEMLHPTSPRTSAAGATSMAVKADDPATRALIDAAIAKRSAKL